MRVALGWKAHSGWAALVALAPADEPFAKAPYHAADRVAGSAARELAERDVASVQRAVPGAIQNAVKRCTDAGHAVCGCAVLVGSGMPPWTTEEILAVHFRMHKAEGELFRDTLVAGARACGLALTTLPDKTALDSAARALGVSRARLDASLAALGKAAGAPWGKDQKEAAAAALVALERSPRAARPAREPRA